MQATETSPEQQARLHALWDSLADLGQGDIDRAWRHLLEEMCGLLHADNAMWAGVVRLSHPSMSDPLGGWRMPVVKYLRPLPGIDATIRDYKDSLDAGPDEKSIRYHAQGGRFRVLCLADLVEPEWFQSEFYQRFFRGGMDAVDVMFVGAPVNDDTEAGLAFYRRETPFDRDACALAEEALRGLRWFQRQLLLGHGLLLADAPLTPVEQQVLQAILQGLSAKEVAAQLDHSLHTTNEYHSRLYRKFGVGGRAELMALWLGHARR
jgi:DNA-binding CsgD family transcriptional regulator